MMVAEEESPLWPVDCFVSDCSPAIVFWRHFKIYKPDANFLPISFISEGCCGTHRMTWQGRKLFWSSMFNEIRMLKNVVVGGF